MVMQRPHENPEHWRMLAHKTRQLAASCDSDETAQSLTRLAERYERIAAELEAQSDSEQDQQAAEHGQGHPSHTQ
jgi:hypothetical protein